MRVIWIAVVLPVNVVYSAAALNYTQVVNTLPQFSQPQGKMGKCPPCGHTVFNQNTHSQSSVATR